jgi:sulfate adenylyltransferase subunit 1 (EFTu-like GTPase family)
MSSTFIPVYLGMRHAIFEIVKIDIAEHRIIWSPEQQYGNVSQPFYALCNRVEVMSTRMVGLERNIGHELAYASAATWFIVGGEIRVSLSLAEPGRVSSRNTTQACGGRDEQRCQTSSEIQEGS